MQAAIDRVALPLLDHALLMLHEPWLIAAGLFAALASMWWGLALFRSQPWLPLIGAALVCLLTRFVFFVEREGLLVLLPRSVAPVLSRPLFEILGFCINVLAVIACNLLRVAMLACMELTDEQRREILTSMDPEFRRMVFQEPFELLLPWSLRRLLLGRAVFAPAQDAEGAATNGDAHVRAGHGPPVKRLAMGRTRTHSAASEPAGATAPTVSPEEARATPRPTPRPKHQESVSSIPETAALRRKSTADNLMELVQGMEFIAQNARASTNISSLEQILTKKMMGTTVLAAKTLATSAQAQALETLEYGKARIAEVGDGIREAVQDPRNQVTAASAMGGAAVLGAGGGATGLVSGGVVGAVCGLVPALFTFGLSIPVGAAIGGGLGLVTGTAVAGTAGFVGGGTLGYHVYGRGEGPKPITDKSIAEM